MPSVPQDSGLPSDQQIVEERGKSFFSCPSSDSQYKQKSSSIQDTLNRVSQSCRPVNGSKTSNSPFVPGRGGFYPNQIFSDIPPSAPPRSPIGLFGGKSPLRPSPSPPSSQLLQNLPSLQSSAPPAPMNITTDYTATGIDMTNSSISEPKLQVVLPRPQNIIKVPSKKHIREQNLDVCLECGLPAHISPHHKQVSLVRVEETSPYTSTVLPMEEEVRFEQIYCDICNIGFHLDCLTPSLSAFPPEDVPWYCPDCRDHGNVHRPLQTSSLLTNFDSLVDRIHQSKNILVIMGAGASVAAGIPDFRSSTGIYAITKHMKLGNYQAKLEAQDLFDIEYFQQDPSVFYHFFFAFNKVTSAATPTHTHKMQLQLQELGKLKRVYTQNIDGLEARTGILQEKIVTCHGDGETVVCTKCGLHTHISDMTELFNSKLVPYCDIVRKHQNIPGQCVHMQYRFLQQSGQQHGSSKKKKKGMNNNISDVNMNLLNTPLSAIEMEELKTVDLQEGVWKPDIVFFGEGQPTALDQAILEDSHRVDLVLVIGTSLKVDPVAALPQLQSHQAPLVLLNKEEVKARKCEGFDYMCLGNADDISQYILYKQKNKK